MSNFELDLKPCKISCKCVEDKSSSNIDICISVAQFGLSITSVYLDLFTCLFKIQFRVFFLVQLLCVIKNQISKVKKNIDSPEKEKKRKETLLSSHLCRISCRWIRVRVQIHSLARLKSISYKGMYGPKKMNGRSLYAKHAYCDIFPCFCFILPSPNHSLLACPARRGKTLHGECRIFGL